MTRCHKYEAWIDDAALGALDPSHERELLAHAGECDACRDAHQHARELAALVDRGVESLVAGEPSPHFAARLRARIADEPPDARFTWFTWKPLTFGLATAATVAALWVFLAPSHTKLPSKSTRPVPNIASAVPIEVPTPAKPTTKAAESDRLYTTETPRHSGTRLLAQRRRHNIRPTQSPGEPEVLVPRGQLEAVIQLASDIRAGRLDGKKFVVEQAEAQENIQKPIHIAPIEIEPIEIPPLSVRPPQPLSDPATP